jgi:hypothetical protein
MRATDCVDYVRGEIHAFLQRNGSDRCRIDTDAMRIARRLSLFLVGPERNVVAVVGLVYLAEVAVDESVRVIVRRTSPILERRAWAASGVAGQHEHSVAAVKSLVVPQAINLSGSKSRNRESPDSVVKAPLEVLARRPRERDDKYARSERKCTFKFGIGLRRWDGEIEADLFVVVAASRSGWKAADGCLATAQGEPQLVEVCLGCEM